MSDIIGPQRSLGHPQRGLDCQTNMQHRFDLLASDAEAAGWQSTEVATALLELAMNRIEARKAKTLQAKLEYDDQKRFGNNVLP
ncbi:hypothetical protein HB779_21735 (plasmid) [Phyllobacterium sp. 628]|uniref:hypothetical protein n=1 Tax=Phyllobacterium sp. 628 TaxID=2718938 RepID=UPI0016623A82|nr:hypothetical protein [Phyllobacterium sp. 628]QND54534.1 hypothetical protein HB779_21735 [Phyllobacterium sp. 628]